MWYGGDDNYNEEDSDYSENDGEYDAIMLIIMTETVAVNLYHKTK